MTLTPGQELIFVRERGGYRKEPTPEPVTVEKIGRRWAYLSRGYRCDKDTLIVDGEGFSSPGRCYLSVTHYEQSIAADAEYKKLCAAITRTWTRPTQVTGPDIRRAAELLGVKLEGK